MEHNESVDQILKTLEPHLAQPEGEVGSTVVMMCGIAGSGKSTLSKALLATHPARFTRLSIDALVHAQHGLFGTDYPPSRYAALQDEADVLFRTDFAALLTAGKDVVLDRAFYARADRDDFRAQTLAAGGRVVLVYFRASEETLWRRIQERRARGRDADSAAEISAGLLASYVAGFEAPEGEGEVVVEVR